MPKFECQCTSLFDLKGTEFAEDDKQARFGMLPEWITTKPSSALNSVIHWSTGIITKAGFFVPDRPTHDSKCGFVVPACQNSNLQYEALETGANGSRNDYADTLGTLTVVPGRQTGTVSSYFMTDRTAWEGNPG